MQVRFWGTRGSIATPGPGTVRFGGNTSCVEVTTNSGACFILDCGTGARALGAALMARTVGPITATILLSHTHWDHIQGFPFFVPLFAAGNRITVCGPEGSAGSLREVLSGQMEFTYFPVEIGQLPASITFQELGEGVHEMNGVRIVTQYLHHPAMKPMMRSSYTCAITNRSPKRSRTMIPPASAQSTSLTRATNVTRDSWPAPDW